MIIRIYIMTTHFYKFFHTKGVGVHSEAPKSISNKGGMPPLLSVEIAEIGALKDSCVLKIKSLKWIFHNNFVGFMLFTFQKFLYKSVFISALFLIGCAANTKPVSDDCRMARSYYQMCYGSCLGSTPGATLTAMGICGNKCKSESRDAARACR